MGLSCHVSADEIHAPRGRTTINRQNMLTSKPWDTKTLRVADPQGGQCCILTAIGTSVMILGILEGKSDGEALGSARLGATLGLNDGKFECRTRKYRR